MNRENAQAGLSRRQFLAGSAAAAITAGLPCQTQGQAVKPRATSRPTSAPSSAAAARRGLVVEARSEHVQRGPGIQLKALDEMLDKSLCRLTNTTDSGDAWHSILRPDDVLGIKLNASSARVLGTTMPLLHVLIGSLRDAGWGPDRIVLIDVDDSVRRQFGTRPADLRYSDHTVDFGCGSDSFVAAVEQVTAIINVPFAKTHNLAVFTGCLKNLSHGLIRRPARFHADGCDPAIARINAAEPLRSRIRLHVVNALRVIYKGGSRSAADDVTGTARMLVSRDPVAADVLGFELLNRVRRERGYSPLLPMPQIPTTLQTAAALGLGEANGERITRVVVHT